MDIKNKWTLKIIWSLYYKYIQPPPEDSDIYSNNNDNGDTSLKINISAEVRDKYNNEMMDTSMNTFINANINNFDKQEAFEYFDPVIEEVYGLLHELFDRFRLTKYQRQLDRILVPTLSDEDDYTNLDCAIP